MEGGQEALERVRETYGGARDVRRDRRREVGGTIELYTTVYQRGTDGEIGQRVTKRGQKNDVETAEVPIVVLGLEPGWM